MATSRTTIELNGKLYDARTGKVMGEGSAVPVLKPSKLTNGAALDGFVRSQQPVRPAVARTLAAHPKAPLEKSKTLMRPAVKKPGAVTKPDLAVSQKQAHFKKKKIGSAKFVHLPLPAVRTYNDLTPESKLTQLSGKETSLAVAAPTQHAHLSAQVARLATSTETQVKNSVEMIEDSLRNATSHLETFEGRVRSGSLLQRIGFRSKVANLGSLAFAGLLLVGFFAYQNGPNLEMRVAAARSGVSAQLPGYHPAGFSAANGIKSEPGKVTVAFKSNTNDKQFSVTQQASNWSSDSLLSNHVLASKQPFQTYQDAGITVYISNNSSATWVNGGIWYRIDGDATLTSDQLLRIANSF